MTPSVMPTPEPLTGNLRNQIGSLEESMPRTNSERYVIPTDQEQADFAKLILMLGNNDLPGAADLATTNNYTLRYYVDRGDGEAMDYLLRENKPIEKGWGLYVFRMDSKSNVVIEAPHPRYDMRTPSVALDIYRALSARALLVAGAHRNANADKSSDVAHAKQSIFQSVHLALTQEIQAESGNVVVLQIHGFHTSKHEGYPPVVLGFGAETQPEETALAQKIKDALAEQGITAGICMGSELQDLCAKTNIQGSAAYDGIFIHMELDESLRRHDEAVIAALVQVFGK